MADEKSQPAEAVSSTADQSPSTEKVTQGAVVTNVPDAEEDKEKHARPERTANFQDYMRIFRYATKWDLAAYAAGLIAAIGSGVTLPLMNVIFGISISHAYLSNDCLATEPSSNAGLTPLKADLLTMFGLFLARFGLGSINKFAFRMIGIRLSAAIRLHYLKSLFNQTVHVTDILPPGYAVGTITSTSNILQLGISEKLGVFVEYNSLIIASIIVSFTWSWELTLVTFSGVVFILLAVSIILPLVLKGHARMGKAESGAAAVASEALASVRMIMACGAEKRTVERYAAFVEEAKKHAQFMSPLISLQFSLVFFGAFASFGLAFWYGTRAFTQGRIDSVGVITVVLLSVMMTVFSLERVSTPLLAVGKASVTFAYPSRPHVKILDNLDLNIEAGKITAIVGPSGSGKSTIVGLIEKWYSLKGQYLIAKAVEKKKDKKKGDDDEEAAERVEPEETGPVVPLSGSVTTGGHSLDDIESKWWRSQIGLVQQEPFLFNDTIFKNVANGLVGSPWENETEERKRELVKEACVEAFADEFIDKLPERYDTVVGDAGGRLSGGQKQRIAIARSIIKKPSILILDEATSAIDVRGEKIVQAALDKVAQGRTTITIAHRLSTIKKADKIVVLKKGKVVETGTHETLMNNVGGVYHGLVQAQALSLGEPTNTNIDSDISLDEADSLTREKSQAKSEREVGKGSPEKPGQKKRNLFNSFGRFFFETKSHWYLMFLAVTFAAGAGAGLPIQAFLFASSIDLFKYAADLPKLMSEAEFWSLMWTVLAIGVGIVYFGGFLSSTSMATVVRAKYQKQYFETILFQKASFFDEEDHSHGTMTSRTKDDPQQLEELMGVNMTMVYIAIFSIIGSIIIALSFTWKLALVAICVVLPITAAGSYFRLRYELQFEKMNNAVFAESSQFASESFGAFRTVTSLTLEDSITERFEKLCQGHVVTAYKKARWVSIIFGFADSSTMACQTLIFYYGGRLLSRGELDVMAFFVCLMAIMNAGESSGQSLSFGPNAAQATAASNRILDARESRFHDQVDDKPAFEHVEGGMKIELRDVGFKYQTRETPVFKHLNLTIEKGQFAALVGASGCGKTSIISLLERFYDLNHGQILCNDKDISELNIYSYRKHLSLVAQEATLFQGTIKENILLGVDPEFITEEKLHAACRDASIHDFIVSLPEGYNTNIGSRGVSLSGGQKQRIAIARALIRDPDILLLDEATSSLDSESEKLVQAAFERAGKGRTMVVVAHRLATVQNADVIFVLGEGKLLEKGSHVELLKKQGVYYQMCQSQALDR
ncbi:unnamed protein product [Clonostachys solani]|uniref:Uncharacterized protein n=1 Tax=Clonostachys solani TaxID=160281 RepID=A0A9N9Z517_9HYPO|nr:unnamed protein product [Clonostachys solani]